MKLFIEFTKRSFRRHLTYRAAALAGLATNFFFGLLRIAVLLALFGDRQVVEGYSVAGIITYTGLTQAVIAYLSIFGWYDLMNSVHSGEVGADLLKPMSYFQFWMAHDLGRALASLLLNGVSFMLLFELVFDLVYPSSLVQWLALAASLCLAWLLSFAFRFLVNLTAFWSPNALGAGRFIYFVALFCSGFMMPLGLFPEWAQQLCHLTPFPYILNTIVDIFLERIEGVQVLTALLAQATWTIALIIAGQLLLRRGVRRLVILGG